MFGHAREVAVGAEMAVDVDAATGRPVRFGRLHVVTAVHGRWREWTVSGDDIECWRVACDPGLVVVLVRDLVSRQWVVREVWD